MTGALTSTTGPFATARCTNTRLLSAIVVDLSFVGLIDHRFVPSAVIDALKRIPHDPRDPFFPTSLCGVRMLIG